MIHRRQKNHQILGGKKSTIWFTIEIVQRVEQKRERCSGGCRERREHGSCGKRECGETEIEGHTRSLRPSSIRIPRISVNGPLLPRPFGQCTVWVVDMSPQIPHILRRMGRWCCRAQPTGIRLVTTACYGPPRAIPFLALPNPFELVDSLSRFHSSFPPISFSLRISVESSTLPTGTMRMAAASLPPRLYASIDTYLPIRAGAMLPISVNKCTPARTYDACRSKPSRFPALRIDAGIRIRFSITRSNEIMTPLRISLYTS